MKTESKREKEVGEEEAQVESSKCRTVLLKDL